MYIEVELEPETILDELTDRELELHGLFRSDSGLGELAEDLEVLIRDMHDDEHQGPRRYCNHPLCARLHRGTNGYEQD